MLGLNLLKSARGKQERVEQRAWGSSYHGSIDKQETSAGGVHTFIQCPTVSRYKAEGDEVCSAAAGLRRTVLPV